MIQVQLTLKRLKLCFWSYEEKIKYHEPSECQAQNDTAGGFSKLQIQEPKIHNEALLQSITATTLNLKSW